MGGTLFRSFCDHFAVQIPIRVPDFCSDFGRIFPGFDKVLLKRHPAGVGAPGRALILRLSGAMPQAGVFGVSGAVPLSGALPLRSGAVPGNSCEHPKALGSLPKAFGSSQRPWGVSPRPLDGPRALSRSVRGTSRNCPERPGHLKCSGQF